MFVRRGDVFDIKFDKFVKEPIMRPVTLPERAKDLANELVDLGFSENLTLGKAPALELMLRLQDICNGFEPIEHREMKIVKGVNKEVRVIEYKPLPENPKLDMLVELLEEIDVEKNQVVVWCSRKALLRGCADRLAAEGFSFVQYDGDSSDNEKANAERVFQSREAQVFIANQASGAYGLNCLAQCSYAVYICIDGSVEKYHQSQHRILRGELHAPKFAYHIYAEGTIEERQQQALRVGQELIGDTNTKDIFTIV
jgi:SNF2 family DNA or RNA helicase